LELSKAISQPGAMPVIKKTPELERVPQHTNHQGVFRETLESIAFAFVLALLFRTFVAEAFVIPTGSMAPTLYGRNKEVDCPACGFQYAIGASDELDDGGTFLIPSRRIEQSMCPNCRHIHDVRSLPVFKGDRILVNKAAYQFQNPSRWDVIVFRYPEDTQKNYIKRLIGLPGETIRVERGDIYARRDQTGSFQILRKQDPNKQKLLQQAVYDDRHAPLNLIKNGWPEAWNSESEGGWKQDPQSRQFEVTASPTPQTVRYSHYVPSIPDWAAADQDKSATPNPRPQLVSDFCGYNAYTGGRSPGLDDDCYWVGDLTLSCTLKIGAVADPEASFTLELNEGVRRYRCSINPTTGTATLTRSDDLAADPATAPQIELAKAQTPIKGAGTYTLRFANVDDRLCLWVNDNWLRSGLIDFGPGAEYDAPSNRRPQDADLRPAAFTAQGLAASVSTLLLERDIYYRAENVSNDAGNYSPPHHEVDEGLRLREALVDPQQWGDIYENNSQKVEFRQLEANQFFVMGDNSPRSQDSRLWPNEVRHAPNRHAVERQALIGKAFFIYWPHGIPFLNGGHGFTLIGHRPVPPNEGQFNRDQFPEEQKEAWEYPEYSIPFYPQWWRWKRIR
jgi:signal peptidase I